MTVAELLFLNDGHTQVIKDEVDCFSFYNDGQVTEIPLSLKVNAVKKNIWMEAEQFSLYESLQASHGCSVMWTLWVLHLYESFHCYSQSTQVPTRVALFLFLFFFTMGCIFARLILNVCIDCILKVRISLLTRCLSAFAAFAIETSPCGETIKHIW